VVSRLLAFATAFAATFWLGTRLHPNSLGISPDTLLERHPMGFVLGAWGHRDGGWFMSIADHGYNLTRAAFFPLYPALLRLLSVMVGSSSRAGVLVSLVCYSAAMVVLYRLVKADFGSQAALWSVVLMSFAPTSFFFQAIYSESLFLLLTLVSFSAGRRGRWLLAGAAGLLATLTRSAGIVLVAPLVWMWLEQRRGREIALPGSKVDPVLLPDRPAQVVSLGWLLLVPAGLGIYMAYTLVRFHNALLFVAAQRYWHRKLSLPTTAVIRGAKAATHSVRAIAARPDVYLDFTRLTFREQWLTVGNLTAFLALLFAAGLLILCWRRLPAAYTTLAVASLLIPLSYPLHSKPLVSLPRYVLVDFPLFIALASTLVHHRRTRWVVLGVMVLGLVLLTATFANDMWVA